MASTHEKGRAKNIANLRTLQVKLTGFGSAYSPTNAALKPANLLTVYNDAKARLHTFDTADGEYKIAANNRLLAFAPISKIISRTRSAIKSGSGSKESKAELDKDAGTLANRYRGHRAKAIVPSTDSSAPNPISVSHTSYVQRAETLNQIIALYTAAGAAYAPSAADLKVASLNALYNTIDAHNNTVGDKITARENARIPLLKRLYLTDTGLVDLGYAAKAAVAEIFGPDSPEYKQVSKINFAREVL